jgi:SAM-dependent methyltransferase
MTHFTARQYEEAYPAGIERHFWHRARNAIIASTLFQTGMAAGSLLEIGCGTGIVVDDLRRRGVDCIGCDLADAPVLDRVRDVVSPVTDFRALPAATRSKIGGVLLCDVLEHLPDASSFVATIRDALPALRRVLVTVPARQELWSVWDDHYGHHRRYDQHSLSADLRLGGFQPILVRYFFHALYGAIYLNRKKGSERIEAPRWSLAHRLIGAGFRVEHQLLPFSLPGTSLIAVASV